jgi:exopolysaccharide production protein ExoZ
LKNERVEMLDYLRGIMALSVLFYHYTTWAEIQLIYPLGQSIDRLGIYAVSAFYVLSGASLALVYSNKTVNAEFLKDFWVKRIFRIVPLFWTVTVLAILLTVMSGMMSNDFSNVPSVQKVLLNFSLLFGWLSPDSYIATGAWSIGNELVFYSIFPVMLFLKNKSIKHYIMFFLTTIIISGYFSFIMDKTLPLAEQWTIYINPLNQLYLFAGGFLFGTLLKKGAKINRVLLMIVLIVSVLLFIFIPTEGNLVTGLEKIIFSIVIFGFCLFAAFWGNVKENYLTRILKYFGDISYSIYLFHPIVWASLDAVFSRVGIFDTKIPIVFIGIISSFIVSTISYYFMEKRFTKLGKKISEKYVLRKKQQREVA